MRVSRRSALTGGTRKNWVTLGLLPVMRDRGKTFREALKLIWIGELLSIGMMEIAMNIAPNDAPGLWRIHARELASGLTTDAYMRVTASN